MNWDRRWLDEPHFGDHVGRAVQALASASLAPGLDTVAVPLIADVLRCWPIQPFQHPHAFALIGLSGAPALVDSSENWSTAHAMLQRLGAAYDERRSGRHRLARPESQLRCRVDVVVRRRIATPSPTTQRLRRHCKPYPAGDGARLTRTRLLRS